MPFCPVFFCIFSYSSLFIRHRCWKSQLVDILFWSVQINSVSCRSCSVFDLVSHQYGVCMYSEEICRFRLPVLAFILKAENVAALSTGFSSRWPFLLSSLLSTFSRAHLCFPSHGLPPQRWISPYFWTTDCHSIYYGISMKYITSYPRHQASLHGIHSFKRIPSLKALGWECSDDSVLVYLCILLTFTANRTPTGLVSASYDGRIY